MLKLLLFGALLVGVYYIFFRKESLTPPSSPDNSPEDTMIPCSKCGTYVQLKETLTREGKHYCSRECLEG
jgi:uncharacterized protein